MSFILDALKKSESDRQRQNDPDISSVPIGTIKTVAPRWVWVMIGLLAINLVILTVVLVNPSPATQPARVSDVAIPVPDAKVGVNSARSVSAPLIRELETTPLTREVVDVPVEEMPPEANSGEPAEHQRSPAGPVAQLTFNDLRASGNLSLPDLNIDIHVYSEKPGDRFVFINMNQYRENATLAEGPLLREITMEGVVLEFAGATFLLPKD